MHGQAAAVANPLVATDLDLAADICGHLAAKITLHLEVRVDVIAQGDQIGVGSQLSTGVVVVLGIRIFTNAAAIRRAVLHA